MNIEDLYIGCPVLFEYCECIVDGLGKDRVHLNGEPEDFWVSPNELEHIPSFKDEFHQILNKYLHRYNTESTRTQIKNEIYGLLCKYVTDKEELDVAMDFDDNLLDDSQLYISTDSNKTKKIWIKLLNNN